MTQITISRVGIQGTQGEQGRVGIPFTYSTTTTQADPGAGALRLNNAALASVTAAVLDATSAASGNPDVSDAIAAYGAGTSAIKARLRIAKASAPDEVWAEYDVTGITDNTTHLSLALTYVDHAGTFTDAMATYLNFSRTGDKGEAGGVDSVNGMTGDVVLSLDADGIGVTPAGSIAATDVQAALEELDSEKTTEAYVAANYLAKLGAGNTTDNAIPRWDGTAGGALQNSGVIIDDSSNLTGIAQLTAAALVAATLALSGQSLTGAQATPLLDLATTWNTTGAPTALKLNVTDTASDAASLLADFQVGGVSKFKVDKAGKATFAASADIENTAGAMVFGNPGNGFSFRVQGVATGSSFASMSATRMAVISTAAIGWTAGADGWVTTALDTALYRDAAGVLAQRNGTNAQALRIYGTYTDASNYERGFARWNSNTFEVGTESAGTGTARNVALISQGVNLLTVTGSSATSGVRLWNLSNDATVNIYQQRAANVAAIESTSSTLRLGPSDGTFAYNFVSTGVMQFGGTTSSYPALKRSSAALQVRLADDSGFANLTAGAFIAEASNGGFRARADAATVTLGLSDDITIGRAAAAKIRLGAADTASPVAQTLSVQNVVAGTNNTAGANLTIAGSQGTGTGAGGSIVFQVAPAGSSGSAQNALANAMVLQPGAKFRMTAGTVAGAVGTGFYSYDNTAFGFGQDAGSSVWGGFTADGLTILSTGRYGFGSSAVSTPDTFLYRDAANTLALRNATAAQAFNIYNTYTDGSNYERGYFRWNSNVLEIGAEAAGTGTQRNIKLAHGSSNSIEYRLDGDATSPRILVNGQDFFGLNTYSAASQIALRSDGALAWANNTTGSYANNTDLILARDAANTLALRNATAAQAFNIYNTRTDGSNYERGGLKWSSNKFCLFSEAAGTGTGRDISVFTGTKERLTLSAAGNWQFWDNGNTNSYLQIAMTADSGSISYYDNSLGLSYILMGDTTGSGGPAHLGFGSGAVIAWQSTARQDSGIQDLTLSRVAANILGIKTTYAPGGAAPSGGASIEIEEMTAPSAPSANGVRIYAQDNGAGKTQLMALFASGAAQQLALEP